MLGHFDGNCGECRGSPWAQLSEGDVGPFQMLTYRQLTKGVYLAWSRSPKNTLVKFSVARGLKRVRCLSSKTPEDVLSWLIRHHNSFHRGSGNSLVDISPEIKRMQADWGAEAAIKGITARTCGSGEDSYYARRWAWFKNDPERYDIIKNNIIKFQHVFDSACTLFGNLEHFKWDDDFKRTMNAITDYRNPVMLLDSVALNLHSFTSMLRSSFQKSLTDEDLALVAFEGFPFFVTVGKLPEMASPHASNRVVPFAFEKHKPDLIRLLVTPMQNSHVFSGAGKAKAKGKSKAKAKAKVTAVATKAKAKANGRRPDDVDEEAGDSDDGFEDRSDDAVDEPAAKRARTDCRSNLTPPTTTQHRRTQAYMHIVPAQSCD